MKKVTIAAVSYQNTIPFVYGLKYANIDLPIELIITPPFDCANNLFSGAADVALIPSVKLLEARNVRVFSDFCISATDNVYTVALFSNRPIECLQTIRLDSDSRTSVALLKILAKEYWNITPQWESLQGTDFSDPNSGYLLIGDKVFAHEKKFKYKYDLSAAWLAHTGKPFVFAVWVATNSVGQAELAEINKALAFGIRHTDQAIDEFGLSAFKHNLHDYLTKSIEFDFSEEKRSGLAYFLEKAKDPSSF